MESNGKVSFLKKLGDDVSQLSTNIIIDGRILSDNLAKIGKNDWWLMKELDARKLKVSDIMLGTVENGKLLFYTFNENDEKNALFE